MDNTPRHGRSDLCPRPLVVSHAEALARDDLRIRMMAHTLSWVTRVVPVTFAVFYQVDEGLQKFTSDDVVVKAKGRPLDGLRTALQRFVSDGHHALDPFAPSRFAESRISVVDVAAIGGRQLFERSMYMRGFLAGLELCDQVTVFLRHGDTIVAGIDLLAGSGDPAINPREVATVRRSQPFLEHAYACSVAPSSEANGAVAAALKGLLTPRESEVAQLVAEGASNAEIARALCLSPATVKTHLGHVFAKLGVRSRTQLALALDSGAVAQAKPRAP